MTIHPVRLDRLPSLIARKLYKTGQTRGAQLSEIYQNRVLRNSTVLIDWEYWSKCKTPGDVRTAYEGGYIVLVNPTWYFTTPQADQLLADEGIALAQNAVLLFQQRAQWDTYKLPMGALLPNGVAFSPPLQRSAPIGGCVLARVHSTTSRNSEAITWGYDEPSLRGAGIRVYEYASTETIASTRIQLEALFWLSHGSVDAAIHGGMTRDGARIRRDRVIEIATRDQLLDARRLTSLRILDAHEQCICPLCRVPIEAEDFFLRGDQAEGRETWDITITEISLFHVEELRVGRLQHRPYNLGWGHHYCNVVAKDAGIDQTLKWMAQVIETNQQSGWARDG